MGPAGPLPPAAGGLPAAGLFPCAAAPAAAPPFWALAAEQNTSVPANKTTVDNANSLLILGTPCLVVAAAAERDFLAVFQNLADPHRRRTALRRSADNGDLVAGLQRALGPSGARQVIGAG